MTHDTVETPQQFSASHSVSKLSVAGVFIERGGQQ
jgi:hypothetical protein